MEIRHVALVWHKTGNYMIRSSLIEIVSLSINFRRILIETMTRTINVAPKHDSPQRSARQ
jgi:hypothetical protein